MILALASLSGLTEPARLLPSCCCNLGTCSAWYAQLEQVWSWHTSHGTTVHNCRSRSKTHPSRHLFHRTHIRCYHVLPPLRILHHSHHRRPWGVPPLLSASNGTRVLMAETDKSISDAITDRQYDKCLNLPFSNLVCCFCWYYWGPSPSFASWQPQSPLQISWASYLSYWRVASW
jgi:hypothetical protein